MVHPVGVYPFTVSIGPYQFALELCEKQKLGRKSENSETDYNHGVIRLAAHMEGRALTEAFLKRLIGIIHFSHATDDAATEEHFTHSFATGLLEFAKRNPQAWVWFNAMLSKHYSKDQRFDQLCLKPPAKPLPAPKRMVLRNTVVRPKALSDRQSDRERVWGYYYYADNTIRLAESLRAGHFEVIFVHELCHAFHHMTGMEDHDTRRRFIRAQTSSLLDFVEKNPSAWKWLVSMIAHGEAGARPLFEAAQAEKLAA